MGINRYNYEDFFLLYADGELGPLEIETVNQFVQFHPDLKVELDILMDCKLVADVPVFFPKEKLYKQTIWDADNITEMQSNLLLLVDGELEEGVKKKLEKNIEENAALRQEWNVLQQAKLPVEMIAHPYKKPLYKEKKIPKLGWLRWAAVAAALVGTGLFLVGKNMGGNTIVEPYVVVQAAAVKQQQPINNFRPDNLKTAAKNNKVDSNKTGMDNNNPNNIAIEKNTVATVTASRQPTKNKARTVKKEALEKNTTAYIIQDVAINDNYRTDGIDGRKNLINIKTTNNIEIIEADKPPIAKIKMAPIIGQLPSTNAKKPLQNLTDVQSDADDNEYVRIAGARIKKQKLRGVFRGVFRGIGRTFSDSKVEAAPAMALNNE